MTDNVWRSRKVGEGTMRADQFMPHPLNPRIHPQRQREAVAASLAQFGQLSPVIINRTNQMIVDGVERIWQALAQGDDTPVDYYEVEISEEEHQRALRVFDATGELAEWDREKLALIRESYPHEENAALKMLNENILARAISQNGNEPPPDPGAQVDRAAELQEKWQVARGDLWQIGEHSLLCGDSTDGDDVARVMGGEKAEILFTSPPYLEARDYSGNDLSVNTLKQFISEFTPYCAFQVVNLGIIRRDHAIVPYWDEYIEFAQQCGLKLLSWNVWDKMESGSVGQQLAMFAIQHEWIFVFGEKPKDLNRTVDKSPESEKRRAYYAKDAQGRLVNRRRQPDGSISTSTTGENYEKKQLPTVIVAHSEKSNLRELHPAVMGADVPYTYIEAMTDSGEIVVDPFGGSGTTMAAAHQLGRRCRMIEIAPEYCSVVLERMTGMGLTPERV